MKKLITPIIIAAIAGLMIVWAAQAADEQKQGEGMPKGEITVTGEVIDMACYIDHGARGEKHAECAKTCIESGLPVGIRDKDGKVYLVIGEHKTLNKELAVFAAKTITVRGKFVSREGINMIANAEIVK